jgi:hypothetical protein
MISKTIDVVVTSVLQTTAGKMIFGRYIDPNLGSQGAHEQEPRRSSRHFQTAPAASATPLAAGPPTSGK